MALENTPQEQRAETRSVFGRALAALVAAQADWNAISEVQGAEREAIEDWAATARVDLQQPSEKARTKLLQVANTAVMSVALGSTQTKADNKLGDLGLL